MFKLSVPLCLAVTLVAICLSVTTDAMPNTVDLTRLPHWLTLVLSYQVTYARGLDTLQDAIVPEEELSLIDAADLSHFTGSPSHLLLSCAQLIDIAQDWSPPTKPPASRIPPKAAGMDIKKVILTFGPRKVR